MPEAARRAGVTPTSIKRALANASVPLIRINAKAIAVEDSDLEAFMACRQRQGYLGKGRPRGAKNKPKEQGETDAVKRGADTSGTD